MLKKTITFIDFDGDEVTEDFYFNVNTVEAAKITAKADGDLEKHAQKIAKSKDMELMIDFIEMMILDSYGEKTADGSQFIKNPEIRSKFEHSAAYAELFEELLMEPSQTQAFGKGIVQHTKRSKGGSESPNAKAAKLLKEQRRRAQLAVVNAEETTTEE